MVHSAIKRKRSSEELSEGVSREQSPTANEPSEPTTMHISTIPSDKSAIFVPSYSGPEDPRPTLLALLHFLSDAELFTLLTTRLSQAELWEAPLYITPYCISGLHNFFIPPRPTVESLSLAASAPSPFSKLPKIADEKGRMGKLFSNSMKTRASAVLVSLATLFNFLTPSELRTLVKTRIASSQAPYHGVGWLLEFLQSGGDSKPRGKTEFETRWDKHQEKRGKVKKEKAEKKRAQEGLFSVSSRSRGAATVPTSNATETSPTAFVPPYDDVAMEEGELASEGSAPGSGSYPRASPVETLSSGKLSGALFRDGTKASQPPHKKKRKKVGTAKVSHQSVTESAGPTLKATFPGIGMPFPPRHSNRRYTAPQANPDIREEAYRMDILRRLVP